MRKLWILFLLINSLVKANTWVEVRCFPTSPYTYCVLEKGRDGGGGFVKFSPDGRLLATASCSLPCTKIKLWDVSTLRPLFVFTPSHPMHRASVLDFSPDGKLLVASFFSFGAMSTPTVKVWDTANGQEIIEIQVGQPTDWVWAAFSQNGKFLAVLAGCTIHVWDTTRWEEIGRLDYPCSWGGWVGFSSNLLVVNENHTTIKLWDWEKQKEVRRISGDLGFAFAFSPNGQIVATGSFEGTIRLWDLSTGEELQSFPGHNGPITSLAFHPTDFLLASTAKDSTIKLWDLLRNQEILSINYWDLFQLEKPFAELPTAALAIRVAREITRINALAFSPDGTLLASSLETPGMPTCQGMVHLWYIAGLLSESS